MNKQELIATVADRTELPKPQIADIVAAVLDTVQETLAAGDQVAIIGFGTFKTKRKPATSGYSPLVKRVVDTPAKTVAVFKAGRPRRRPRHVPVPALPPHRVHRRPEHRIRAPPVRRGSLMAARKDRRRIKHPPRIQRPVGCKQHEIPGGRSMKKSVIITSATIAALVLTACAPTVTDIRTIKGVTYISVANTGDGVSGVTTYRKTKKSFANCRDGMSVDLVKKTCFKQK